MHEIKIKEKQASRRCVPKITFAVLSIISFFCLTFIVLEKQNLIISAANQIIRGHSQNGSVSQTVKGQVLSTEARKISPALPARLKIPSIKVDAAVESVGLTTGGAMDVPDDITNAGWYKLGPSPGEAGNAVIAGHFDGKDGNSGAFNNLDKLKPGDKVYVVNAQGATVTFVVRTSKIYNPGYADEVFFPNDNGKHLNLVTCDGVWDKDKKSYTKRLVVFTDIVNE